MSHPTMPVDDLLRRRFKTFNRFMLLLWRLGLGGWVNAAPETGGQIMVLVHRGRSSGREYRTPVNYALVDGELYCMAGFGAVSDWYRNLLANPQVEVWLPDGWYAATAEEVPDGPDALPKLRAVLIASGFAARAAGLDPLRMSAEQLRAAAREYRLVHLRRDHALTGPGGPGDLAWVWPVATLLLLPLALFRRRCRR